MTDYVPQSPALVHEHFHDHIIEQALPAWVSQATPVQVATLHQRMRASLDSQRELSTCLSALEPMEPFCAPLLKRALQQHLGDGLNLYKDIFVATHKEPVLTSMPIGVPVTDIVETPMSLFEAALRNFSPDQAQANGLFSGSRLLTARTVAPTAQGFVTCCRAVDLGGAYQAHLRSKLLTPGAQSIVAESFRDALRLDAQIAFLKGELQEHEFQILEQACSSSAGYSAQAHRLKLLGVELSDILVFDLPAGDVIAYLPGDSSKPLQTFGSLRLFADDLAHRLRAPAYQRFFSRFVPRAGYVRFFATLQARLPTSSGSATVGLDERLLGVEEGLFNTVARLKISRILNDAALLAVPTATLDREAAIEHARRRRQEGLTLLNLAGLFVPGLGEIMLGVAVWQLMGEVYHGVKDWRDGDVDEALGHLFNVAANVALIGATAIGVTVARQAFSRSGFVDGLLPADLENGRARLWDMNLAAYRQALPRLLEADATGLYRDGARQWVGMGGEFYPVRAVADTRRWQLLPHDDLAPALVHNDAGAWRLRMEDPLQWREPHELFRRLGHLYSGVDGQSIDRILEVTGIDAPRLRQWHVECLPPDANFQDTCVRFAINGRIEALLARLNRADLPVRGADYLFDTVVDSSGESDAAALVAQLQRQRVDLFESQYRQSQATDDAQALLLRRDFPSLTLAAAKEMLTTANSEEIQRMDIKRQVPLRLAELARRHVRETRITRALEGRYLHTLKRAELAQAPTGLRREEVATFLQLPDLEPHVRWPTRSPSGRLGYLLSGRGQGQPRALLSRVREIYPGLDEDEIQWWIEQQPGMDLSIRLDNLRRQSNFLAIALQEWIDAVATAPMAAERLLRRQVARSIEDAWCRRSPRCVDENGRFSGYSLTLDQGELPHLPSLPLSIDFSHVSELSITGIGLDSMPDSFFRSFTGLRQLVFAGNRLQQLPAHLDRCLQLTTLDLRDNFIHLDTRQSLALGRLRNLQRLDLSGNPIGPTLDLSSFDRLRSVMLCRTQIETLPTGLLSRYTLELADLRHNRIRSLPQQFFQAPRWVSRNLVLSDNPLERSTVARLDNFREAPYRVGPEVGDAAALYRARLNWLAGSPVVDQAQRGACWDALMEEAGGSPFFAVLEDLQSTADFLRHRNELTARVFELVQAMHDNAQLRRAIFEHARLPRTCQDSVAGLFSALEIKRLVWQANATAGAGTQGAALLQLARRLFRLDEVERFALRDIQSRENAGVDGDEVEISLAYRIGLRESLQLPGQPMSMLFRGAAQVDRYTLGLARRQVLAAEQGEALQASVSQRDFWVEYLQVRHRQAFDETDAPFHEQVEQLMNPALKLPDAEHLRQMEAIGKARKLARDQLIMTLTEKALGRHSS